MRHSVALLGAILFSAFNLHAQVNPNYSLPQVSPAQDAALPASAPEASPLFALASTPAIGALEAPRTAASVSSASSDSPAQQPTSVYGVFQNYNWQIYAGYSFFRFYVVSRPNTIESMNGLDLGVVYFLPKVTWLGFEGQYVGEWGSLFAHTSQFDLGLGGARFRWSAPRGMVLWAHVLVGGSTFTPQTAYGGQGAFGYEAGGGVDVGAHHRRIAYRLELDTVGTRYFSTYQYSPRMSVGIVFKY